MAGADLPIEPALWLAAIAPLAVILALLVGLRWKAASAAPVGYFITVLLAILLFDTSLAIVTAQTVKGVWDALFIAYVIVPALLLYQISDEAGAFVAIRRGIERFSPNSVLHVLAFGWVFSSFLQGITGFGAPVAVVAPLLVAIGVRPLWAVVIPVIGHAWAKSFGTLAVAWEGLGRVVDIPDPFVAAVSAGVMLTAVDVIGAVMIAWIFGRMRGVREGLPMILVIGAIHGIGLIVLAPLAANLAVVVPGIVAVGAVLVLARTIYSKPSGIEDSPIMAGGDEAARSDRASDADGDGDGKAKPMPIWLAFVPYIILIVLIMAVQLIPLIREPLAGLQVGLPFPSTETGFGVPTESTDAYSAFSPLTHPGTFLLLSSVVAFLLYRSRGYIEGGRIDEIGVDTVRTSIPSVMALLALIPLAQVLQGSGMVLELALGIAAVATGPIYAFLAPVIGMIGGFLTGSNLSSNILFAPLQSQAAGALEVNRSIILGAQTAGAAVGGAIALSTVLLGVGAVGESGRSGEAVRRALPFAVAAVVAVGIITVIAVLVVVPAEAGGGGAGG
jgi:lactate permease